MAEKEKEGRSRVTEWRRKVRADKELEKKARDGTLQVRPADASSILTRLTLSHSGWPRCCPQPVGGVRRSIRSDLSGCRPLRDLWRLVPVRSLLALLDAPSWVAAGWWGDFGAGPQGKSGQTWRVQIGSGGELDWSRCDSCEASCCYLPLKVTWNSSDKSLWTLAMVGPDSHLQGEGEVLHWLVANIPGNKVDEGQTLAPYLQPHPPYGTGYHRWLVL